MSPPVFRPGRSAGDAPGADELALSTARLVPATGDIINADSGVTEPSDASSSTGLDCPPPLPSPPSYQDAQGLATGSTSSPTPSQDETYVGVKCVEVSSDCGVSLIQLH